MCVCVCYVCRQMRIFNVVESYDVLSAFAHHKVSHMQWNEMEWRWIELKWKEKEKKKTTATGKRRQRVLIRREDDKKAEQQQQPQQQSNSHSYCKQHTWLYVFHWIFFFPFLWTNETVLSRFIPILFPIVCICFLSIVHSAFCVMINNDSDK